MHTPAHSRQYQYYELQEVSAIHTHLPTPDSTSIMNYRKSVPYTHLPTPDSTSEDERKSSLKHKP